MTPSGTGKSCSVADAGSVIVPMHRDGAPELVVTVVVDDAVLAPPSAHPASVHPASRGMPEPRLEDPAPEPTFDVVVALVDAVLLDAAPVHVQVAAVGQAAAHAKGSQTAGVLVPEVVLSPLGVLLA